MSKRLNQTLPKLLRTQARKRGFAEAELLIRWPQVCPQIAHSAHPVKLRGEVLTLNTASSSVSQQVSVHAPQLIAQINSFFGQNIVKSIKPIATYQPMGKPPIKPHKFELSPTATHWANAQTQHVRDDSLRQKLSNLGAVIKQSTL